MRTRFSGFSGFTQEAGVKDDDVNEMPDSLLGPQLTPRQLPSKWLDLEKENIQEIGD